MTVRQLWEVFTKSNTFSKTLLVAALVGLCSLAGLPLLGTGIVKDLLLTNLAKGNTHMGFLLIGYLVLNTLFTDRFGLGLLTRLAEGHRPHWLGGWQLFAISLLTIPQVFIHLFVPKITETHYSWMIFSMVSFAAILALMYKPRLFYPQLQHIAGVRMPTVNITGNSLKSILAFVALPNQLLDRIPLIFARAGVIASHTLHLSERIVVEALRIGFKATLFPIRFMVVDVIHLRLSRVLFYAILVLAASLYFLA